MTKLETARKLAEAHFQVEPYLKFVYVIGPLDDENPDDPIRLLEVVEGGLSQDFWPVSFAPDPAHGIHYPVIVVDSTPSAFESIKNDGHIRLGDRDWELGEEVKRG